MEELREYLEGIPDDNFVFSVCCYDDQYEIGFADYVYKPVKDKIIDQLNELLLKVKLGEPLDGERVGEYCALKNGLCIKHDETSCNICDYREF